MSLSLPDCPKFTLSRTGLTVHQDLSFDEWAGLASRLSEAQCGIAFVIGDWLVYGEKRFGRPRLHAKQTNPCRRVPPDAYERVVSATGLDRVTLHAYAHVARHVPRTMRHPQLSWEHHRAVAKLTEHKQQHWLALAARRQTAGEPVSTRRLRKSIIVGRLLKPEEMLPNPADQGRYNHLPFVNRLCTWWSWMRQQRWLEKATKAQRTALKRDLKPLVDIYHQL